MSGPMGAQAGETAPLVERLQAVHDEMDDRGMCPYFRRGEPGQDPHGICSFGCREEPSCMTDYCPPGWPSQMLREVIADLQAAETDSSEGSDV